MALLSSKGINTAILDLTKNKNSYYIYTLNEDSLRDRAFRCIEGLRRGVAEGIQVDKNLTVYTNVAKDDDSEYDDYENILETLVKNHSLILLDCDFNTNINYFAKAQELYLVQTYDILTIQPLTLLSILTNNSKLANEDELYNTLEWMSHDSISHDDLDSYMNMCKQYILDNNPSLRTFYNAMESLDNKTKEELLNGIFNIFDNNNELVLKPTNDIFKYKEENINI